MNTPGWVKRAKVGDKVVCKNNIPFVDEPAVGGVYEIADIFSDTLMHDNNLTDVGFRLKGITLPKVRGFQVSGFAWFDFKPVSKRSTNTGMKALKSILNGAPIKEDAHA